MSRRALIDVGFGVLVALVVLLLADGPAAAGLIGLLLALVAGLISLPLWLMRRRSRAGRTSRAAVRQSRTGAPRNSAGTRRERRDSRSPTLNPPAELARQPVQARGHDERQHHRYRDQREHP